MERAVEDITRTPEQPLIMTAEKEAMSPDVSETGKLQRKHATMVYSWSILLMLEGMFPPSFRRDRPGVGDRENNTSHRI